MRYELGEVIFKAENITHIKGNKLILKNLSFDIRNTRRDGVEQGQIIGLLGQSGIGKTQLFNILTGLTTPKQGKILIGKDLSKIKVGDVGIIAQDYPLLRNKTIHENLSTAITQSGDTDKREERIKYYLERFGMLDTMENYPEELSGGQRQRIAIIQQVLCGHRFLLMDEPFSGLDIIMEDEVKRLIREISIEHEENTIIIITHNIEAAAEVADEVWIMGRDRDGTNKVIPGSYIKHKFDLKKIGIAWKEEKQENFEFNELIKTIKKTFKELKSDESKHN